MDREEVLRRIFGVHQHGAKVHIAGGLLRGVDAEVKRTNDLGQIVVAFEFFGKPCEGFVHEEDLQLITGNDNCSDFEIDENAFVRMIAMVLEECNRPQTQQEIGDRLKEWFPEKGDQIEGLFKCCSLKESVNVRFAAADKLVIYYLKEWDWTKNLVQNAMAMHLWLIKVLREKADMDLSGKRPVKWVTVGGLCNLLRSVAPGLGYCENNACGRKKEKCPVFVSLNEIAINDGQVMAVREGSYRQYSLMDLPKNVWLNRLKTSPYYNEIARNFTRWDGFSDEDWRDLLSKRSDLSHYRVNPGRTAQTPAK